MRAENEIRAFRIAMAGKLNTTKNRKKKHWRDQSRIGLLFGALCEWFELAGAVLTLSLAEIKHERRQSARSAFDLEQARKALLYEAVDVGAYSMMIADNCGALEDV